MGELSFGDVNRGTDCQLPSQLGVEGRGGGVIVVVDCASCGDLQSERLDLCTTRSLADCRIV